ncbi:MAG TPA: hypothetical protein DGA22_00845 [Acidobacterium sp.]|nr:hypothetical protein [Acidobacterium sp.]
MASGDLRHPRSPNARHRGRPPEIGVASIGDGGDGSMCDPEEAAAKAVGESVGKILDSEVAKNLLAPVTTELGLALGEIGSAFRFYVSENLKTVFKKWANQRQGQPVDPEQFQRVLPLLQDASLQSDDALQERWAALLESTVTRPENVLPSFGNTLSQLTAHEARYLDELWTAMNRKFPVKGEPYRRNERLFDFRFMMFVFDPQLSTQLLAEYKARRMLHQPVSQAEMNASAKRDELRLIIQDFKRLGIIGTKTELAQGSSSWIETDEKAVEIPGEVALFEQTFFTPYGRGFIKAVRPKAQTSEQ